jgi:hypothetical protein
MVDWSLKKLTDGGLAGLMETDSRFFVNGSEFQSQQLKDSKFDTPYGGPHLLLLPNLLSSSLWLVCHLDLGTTRLLEDQGVSAEYVHFRAGMASSATLLSVRLQLGCF